MNKLFSLSRRAICLENKIYFNSCCKLSNIQSKFSLSHLTASKEPTPDISVAQVCSVSYNSKRLYSASKKTSKGKNEKKSVEEDEDEDKENSDKTDDDDDDNDGDDNEDINTKIINSIDTSNFGPGYKIIVKTVPSLRLDSILSAGLNLSRKKIDDNFYSGKVRLNGEKPLKKSTHIKQGDRVDLIGDTDEKNSGGKRTLKRVVLEQVVGKSKKERTRVAIVIWKSGLYEDDAYKFKSK